MEDEEIKDMFALYGVIKYIEIKKSVGLYNSKLGVVCFNN